jgi:hypothetical protein
MSFFVLVAAYVLHPAASSTDPSAPAGPTAASWDSFDLHEAPAAILLLHHRPRAPTPPVEAPSPAA